MFSPNKTISKNTYRPFVLVILDGYGIAPSDAGNAVRLANTPFLNKLFADYPYTELKASGEAVGLFPDSVGNSEAGHLNLGAGRIVWQDLVAITKMITDGTFFKNAAFLEALDHHLTITANFQELYGALTDSCKAIYGIGTKECRNLVKAMQGAELDQPGKCVAGSVERSPLCNVKLNDLSKYIWRSDNLQDVSFKETIVLPPVIDPGLIFDNNVLTNPDVGVNSGVVDNTTPNSQNSTPATTPVVTPAVEEEVRKPSFTVDVIQNGKTVTVNGKLNYYGKGAKCSGPRYFDPIIVAWGQVNTHPVLNSDNTFTSTHEYNVKNKEYNLSVSVTNSCFGSYVFHKTLTFPL